MKSNKCNNCGATVNVKTLTCTYCGSTYIQPTEQTKTKGLSTFSNLISDLSKALKPLDDAIKPLYNELRGDQKKSNPPVNQNDGNVNK